MPQGAGSPAFRHSALAGLIYRLESHDRVDNTEFMFKDC